MHNYVACASFIPMAMSRNYMNRKDIAVINKTVTELLQTYVYDHLVVPSDYNVQSISFHFGVFNEIIYGNEHILQ